jgi:prepilin-type processing-associated H-X9-DG protein
VIEATGPIQSIAQGQHIGWLAQILPQIEQSNAYKSVDFAASAYGPTNTAVRNWGANIFTCPSDGNSTSSGMSTTNYAGCHHDTEAPIDADNNGVLFLNSHVRLGDISDGTSQTILIGEKLVGKTDLGWLSGTRATLRNTGTPINVSSRGGVLTQIGDAVDLFGPAAPGPLPAAPANAALAVGGFESSHPGGCLVAFADGSVHFLRGSLGPPVLPQLGHRADGKLLDERQF